MTKTIVGIVASVLLLAGLVPALDAQTVLLEEEFESSWSTTSPPAGWTIHYGSSISRDDWHRVYRSGDYCANIYYWFHTETDELISPVIDCSSYGEVWIAVDHYYSHYSGPYTTQWRGSDDGGSTFPHIIWDYAGSSYGSYPFSRDSMDITSWAANEPDVHVNFYADGYSWNMNYWYVDNVIVYGWEGGGGGDEDIDLEMVQIIRPGDVEETGTPFTPACRVYNNIDDTVTAMVRCMIIELETRDEVYSDELSNYPCPPGYEEVNAFKSFTPQPGKAYNAEFIIDHPDDIDPTNNNDDKDFNLLTAQVNAIEILSPQEVENFYFAPEAIFKEMKEQPAEDVRLHCSIHDEAFLAEVYHDSTDLVNFEPLEEKTQAFTQAELEDGEYEVRFWAADARGGVLSDPSYYSKAFTFAGVAEEPTAELTDLRVSGGTVTYSLAGAGEVSIKVYDASGSVVETLVEGTRGAGTHVVNLSTADLSSGVYFVKMVTADKTLARKVMVLH